ncbi:MAG: M1 family aminopeptidase/hydrolase, partial [Flavobacteriales bacterium]
MVIVKKSMLVAAIVGTVLVTGCSEQQSSEHNSRSKMLIAQSKLVQDNHSFSKPNEIRVSHLDWDAEVVFETKTIRAVATYDIQHIAAADQIIFDVKKLNIEKVLVDGQPVNFEIGEEKEFLGSPLKINVKSDSKKVAIHYTTSPGAEALLWVDGEKPFLFTQSQAILARTWIPCQDSPGLRITYNANVKVRKDLLALMSADNPTSKNESGIYSFRMDQKIPSYLIALAVGDIEFKAIGERTGVYAIPSLIDAAAYEFEDMQKMLEAAEKLYGEYAWGRYDVLVLPPAFPFGGMENPKLTFATPTIIAGDKSLVSLIAHELAHSWSGNLVTNATWNDFWLNEGFTVYFEERIMESVYGRDYSEMLAQLSRQELDATVAEFMSGNEQDT